MSLRDLAATIVDISGFAAGSPFPGCSLVTLRDVSSNPEASGNAGASPAFAELAHEIPPYSRSAEFDDLRWPLAALVHGDWSYFRRDGNVRELLFNLHADPGEVHNRADDPATRPTLERNAPCSFSPHSRPADARPLQPMSAATANAFV